VTLAAALDAVAASLDAAADELGRLDAVAGDGDHGIGMQRGSAAAAAAGRTARDGGASAPDALRAAADAWAASAGGTSGAFWREMLASAAGIVEESARFDAATLARIARAADESVRRFGKAEVGDKTLVDALAPFAAAVDIEAQRSTSTEDVWRAGIAAAADGRDSTAFIAARRGRSKTHGDASLGTKDPGAVSFVLVVETLARHIPETSGAETGTDSDERTNDA
jgi:dihydroxyacetone kinase